MHRGLEIYGIITSIGMLIVLLQGVLVTATDSGDGCGSTWPLCFGEVMPQSPALETIIEYSHRLVSGLVGLLVIILAIWSWKKLSHIRETKFWAIMAVLFIIFQGLMGAGAVVWGNSNIVLALHFGISAISFATVVILTVLAFEDGKEPITPKVSKGFRYYLFFVLVYCYAVIYTGAYVKHTGSSYACPDFPLCHGQVLPDLSVPGGFQISVQLLHRFSGILLLIFLIILFIWAFKQLSHVKLLTVLTGVSVLLVLIQAGSGVAIVYIQDNITTSLIHASVISLLFTVLCYIGMIITRRR
ncbi:COX15/CtaA family protein [Salsuginibacillus kocurii]|uniref:COX15/CtaA family protein n=1 Tax=Salsuginibacillus kocurii TaxID=427078 RepID=UPI000371D0EA|nr:heme A synthase [Salsuginibacillus kocurii]